MLRKEKTEILIVFLEENKGEISFGEGIAK